MELWSTGISINSVRSVAGRYLAGWLGGCSCDGGAYNSAADRSGACSITTCSLFAFSPDLRALAAPHVPQRTAAAPALVSPLSSGRARLSHAVSDDNPKNMIISKSYVATFLKLLYVLSAIFIHQLIITYRYKRACQHVGDRRQLQRAKARRYEQHAARPARCLLKRSPSTRRRRARCCPLCL